MAADKAEGDRADKATQVMNLHREVAQNVSDCCQMCVAVRARRRRTPCTWHSQRCIRHGCLNRPADQSFVCTRGGEGCTHVVHGRSLMTIDPRIPTMPGRSTSGFDRPGIARTKPSDASCGVGLVA